MTRRTAVLLLALFLAFVTTTPAFAFPPDAFSGGATSQSLDLTLDLTLADLSVDIGALDAAESFDDVSPRTTDGVGNGVDVVVSVGDPDLAVDVINVASAHTPADGPNADTDSESVTNVDTELIDLAVAEMNTSSHTSNTTADTSMDWSLAGLVLHGDVLGVTDLLTTDALTGTAHTEVAPSGMVSSMGHSRIDGLVLEVSVGPAPIELVTADLISTTSSAQNNGTLAGANAYANTEFVNLLVQGEVVSTAPGTVIDLELGEVVIGNVTIRPVETATATTNQSSADTVALRVTILPILGLIGANIDVGSTSADASVPSSPTAVTMSEMQLTTGNNLPYAFLALGLLAAAAGLIAYRRR